MGHGPLAKTEPTLLKVLKIRRTGWLNSTAQGKNKNKTQQYLEKIDFVDVAECKLGRENKPKQQS